MNFLKEEIYEYNEENERIKVYLKIKPSLASDKIFYNVSKDKKIFSLLDNITLDDPKKSKKIELDKIFTNKDENAYIYEEIMRNCVKNSLDGDNFTFISYGDSNSEKHQLIIGAPDCYENINNRGLLPRLLESYINKIDSNEILSDTISLNLSYILINDNNLIDLSQFMGIDNKILEKITKDDLIKKYSKEIKINEKNINFLKSIKKAPIEKANDSLFFLLQILNLFYKLEATNNHFLTWSYFIIIIYVTDNNGKIISTINFIIMPGNEILLHRYPKTKAFLGTERKDSISRALKTNAFECFFAIEDILAYLDPKHLSQENKNNLKRNENKKIEIKSKLFHIMGNLSFDINNKEAQYYRKYVIIGSIFGNSGLITNIKDTLQFLSQCQKFSRQKIENKNRKEDLVDTAFFKERIKIKNEQIYDLESKLITQEKKLNELNILMDNKELNLKALQDNYKQQIEVLKEELGFEGDIDKLLKNDKKSKEYEYALNIRKTIDNNRIKNIKIEELKNQIVKIETEIKQLKNILNLREEDITMMEMIRTVYRAKVNKIKDIEIKNTAGQQIENLEKQNKILEKKISFFKKEINLKKIFLNQLPDIFKKNSKSNINIFKNRINDTNKDFSLKLFEKGGDSLKTIQNSEKKEKEILLRKYENIDKQNKYGIIGIGNKLDNTNNNFVNEKNRYLDELVFLYKSIINLIKLYKKAFTSNYSIFMKKEKFDKILYKEEKYINPITFPLLYKELGKIGYKHFQLSTKTTKTKPKIIKSKYYKNIKEENENIEVKNEEKSKKENETINYIDKYKKNEKIYKILEELKDGNKESKLDDNIHPVNEIIEQKKEAFKDIVKKSHGQFISMSLEEMQIYSKKFNESIEKIENFIKMYIGNINNIHKFDPSKEKITAIKEKLKSLNNKINETYYKYENNNIVFENGDKVIQRLKNENYLLRKKINEYDKKYIYSTLSPTNHFSKFKTRNNIEKNNIKSNNYNTILTTASSNVFSDTSNIPNSNRGFMEQYFYSTINSKKETDANDNYYKTIQNDFFQRRPTSSFKRINPYFIVGENL